MDLFLQCYCERAASVGISVSAHKSVVPEVAYRQ